MHGLALSGDGGGSSATGIGADAFAQVTGAETVLGVLAQHEHFTGCSFAISAITGGAHDGCYRLKVTDVAKPCMAF